MGLNFKPMENIEKNKLIVIMGEPKSGKTTFTNSLLEEGQKGLYIECGYDNGSTVLDQDKWLVSSGEIKNTEEMGALNVLILQLKELKKNKDLLTQVKWLVLDPISNLEQEQKEFMEKLIGKQLNQNEYGQIGKTFNDLKKVLSELQEDVNICLLTHTKPLEIKDQITNIETMMLIPNLTVNNGKKFTSIADMIGCTKIYVNEENTQYGMIIGGNPLMPTGTRTKKGTVVPMTPVEPDYQSFKKLFD